MKSMKYHRFLALLVVVLALLALFPVELQAAAPGSSGVAEPAQVAATIHTVQRGETLSGIAQKYGTSIAELMRLNNLRSANVIYVGQRLVINASAASSGATGVHVVSRGQTLSGIAQNYGTTVAALRQANNLRSSTIFVGQRLQVPAAGASSGSSGAAAVVHVVKIGENLSSIARQYGVSVQAIAERNGIANTSLIKVGQRLVISGNPTATTPAPSGPKKIVVDISEQRCRQYQGETLLNTWACSTGMRNATKTGTFRVQSKLRKAYGSTWDIWMPYWLGIYWAGSTENGIHGIPWNASNGRKIWAGLVGTPATYGCVMLKDAPMETLWNWADIGTQVVIKR